MYFVVRSDQHRSMRLHVILSVFLTTKFGIQTVDGCLEHRMIIEICAEIYCAKFLRILESSCCKRAGGDGEESTKRCQQIHVQ